MGSPHTSTIVITVVKTSWFYPVSVQFPRARHHTKPRCSWVGIKGSTCNGHHDPKFLSVRHVCMGQEDTGAPSEGATGTRKAADEAVGFACPLLTMWLSSRRLVCRGRLEPGVRVNDICRNHWSQNQLTTKPDRPNCRAISLAV
ncbi:uncharacterized protein TNCV_3539051 [Trichonephila clavipes]|nr:uncharacterized protein TNCV_3539051 [Trichonephila clavipes]